MCSTRVFWLSIPHMFRAVRRITFLAVGIAQVVYTRKCLTPPAYFSALTVGYKVAGYRSVNYELIFNNCLARRALPRGNLRNPCSFRYGMEALLLARKLAIIASGIAFQDAFWAVIACLATYGPMFKILIHWKPYATQGSQFDARLVQSVILLLLVRRHVVVICSLLIMRPIAPPRSFSCWLA